MKNISIIINTKNREEFLYKTLNAIKPQLRKGDQAIIVSDGGPYTVDMHPFIFLRQPDKGYRLATARNLGLRHCTNATVITTDEGCIPHKGWLKAFRKAINSKTVLQGLVRFQRMPQGQPPYPYGEWEGRPREGGALPDELRIRTWGANICFRRLEAQAIGGFDERFNGYWGFNDVAFVYALYCNGARYVPCYDAVLDHLWHKATATIASINRSEPLFHSVIEEYRQKQFPEWIKETEPESPSYNEEEEQEDD